MRQPFFWELRVCPPPNNVCQQNVEVTCSALGFKIRCLRTVGYTLFCHSPTFRGGGVKRVIPIFFIRLEIKEKPAPKNEFSLEQKVVRLLRTHSSSRDLNAVPVTLYELRFFDESSAWSLCQSINDCAFHQTVICSSL